MLREGGHELGVAGERGFFEIGVDEAFVCGCSFCGIVHEEGVEQLESGGVQPFEDHLEMIVRLDFKFKVRQHWEIGVAGPNSLARSSEQVDDLVQLIDLGLAR